MSFAPVVPNASTATNRLPAIQHDLIQGHD